MSMKKILLAGVAGTFIAGTAMATEPVTLTDNQMDTVSAGALSLNLGIATFGTIIDDQGNDTGVSLLSANATTSVGSALNETVTVSTLQVVPGTSLFASQNQTQSQSQIIVEQSSANNGGLLATGGTFGASGSLSISNFTLP